MTQNVYILHGLPASGKSTWASELCHNDATYKRVNKDSLRAMMNVGQGFSRENEFATVRVRDATIVQLLLLGFNVIVDDTNIQPYHIQTIRTLANVFGARVTLFHFAAPVDTCIARDAARPAGEQVGREVILRMAEELKTVLADGWPTGIEIVLYDAGSAAAASNLW